VFPKVVTVLDATIANSSEIFAFRPKTNEATVFLAGKDILTYLQSLDSGSADSKSKLLHVVDFAALAAEGTAGTTSNVNTSDAPIAKASAPNKKAEAKIEDAHQLAIGVKKEVDFATWYTNVSFMGFWLNLCALNTPYRFSSNRRCWTTTMLAVAIFSSHGHIPSGRPFKVIITTLRV
jgi:hypothetical protein